MKRLGRRLRLCNYCDTFTKPFEREKIMERNQYMDFLKGGCILAVIIGHSITYIDKLSVLFNIIYSFHMPLLIFVSGFLEEGQRNKYILCTHKMVRRRFVGLLIPYISWNLIYSLRFEEIIQFQYVGFWDRIIGRNQSGLWFLAVLFGLKCVHALYWKMQRKFEKNSLGFNILLMGIMEMGIILLAIFVRNSYIVNMISYAIPYFCGVLWAKKSFIHKLVENDFFVMLCIICYFFVFQIFDFYDTAISTQVIRIILALCVITLCCKYQKKWVNNRKWKNILCVFGRYSLGIYLIHVYFLDYREFLLKIDSAWIAGVVTVFISVGIAITSIIIVKILSLSQCVSKILFGKDKVVTDKVVTDDMALG